MGLQDPCRLLGEIRQGVFLPDSTRSGRLVGRTELLTSEVAEELSSSMLAEPRTYRPQPFVLPDDTNLRRHKKLRTCHLIFLLVGRRCTDMYETADPNQRFDVSKCRQCFKSKLLA